PSPLSGGGRGVRGEGILHRLIESASLLISNVVAATIGRGFTRESAQPSESEPPASRKIKKSPSPRTLSSGAGIGTTVVIAEYYFSRRRPKALQLPIIKLQHSRADFDRHAFL